MNVIKMKVQDDFTTSNKARKLRAFDAVFDEDGPEGHDRWNWRSISCCGLPIELARKYKKYIRWDVYPAYQETEEFLREFAEFVDIKDLFNNYGRQYSKSFTIEMQLRGYLDTK